MPKKPNTSFALPAFLDKGIEAARASIVQTVRTRYFPELWYILENWFFLLKQKRVLAVGHGFGLVAEALAKSGWDVTVVDPSLTALTELKNNFAKAGLSGAFEQAEPDALPFANGAFQAVASLNTLELAQDPYKAAHEVARVLAPGGRAVVATFNRLGPWGIPAVLRVMRPDDDRRHARCVGKTELKQILKATDLGLEDVKERAQYLPVGAKMPKLPLAGAYIALLSKTQVTATNPALETSLRPRSRPSLSRKPPTPPKGKK